jgi:hypothetical protein
MGGCDSTFPDIEGGSLSMMFDVRMALRGAVLALVVALLVPSATRGQTVINIPPSNPVTAAGAGVTVNVLPGGQLNGNFQVLANGTLNIDGGLAYGISAASLGTVHMVDGSATSISADAQSLVTISGGHVAGAVATESLVEMSGGRVGSLRTSFYGAASAVISGGAIETLRGQTNSTIELVGLDFAIDGVSVSGLNNVGDTVQVNLPTSSMTSLSSVLTGTLADGRALGHDQWSSLIENGVLTLRRSATPAAPTAGDIHVTSTSPLEWIGAGQNVFVEPGGRLPEHFDSTLTRERSSSSTAARSKEKRSTSMDRR